MASAVARYSLVALFVGIAVLGAAHTVVAEGGIEERIAEFWKRVDALRPSDHLSTEDLGQWALNVIGRDPSARIGVPDFRTSTASMQASIERAGPAPTSARAAEAGIEQRVADFWRRVDSLGPADFLSASDLGQWALNVIGRDPRARIGVADFRASSAGMQSGIERAGPVPPKAQPECIPGPTTFVEGYARWAGTPVANVRVEVWQGQPGFGGRLAGSTTTSADGHYRIPVANVTELTILVPAQSVYGAVEYPLSLFRYGQEQCRALYADMGLYKFIKGISLAPGTTIGQAPKTVTWNALPGATEYCVNVLNTRTGQWEIAGTPCPGSPSYVYIGPATTYTIPSLTAGSYQLVILAFMTPPGDGPVHVGDGGTSLVFVVR